MLEKTDGPVAQWIRRLTTNQEIPGSSPGRVDFCLSGYSGYPQVTGCYNAYELPTFSEMKVF